MEVREPNARYLVKPGFKQTEVGVIPEDWGVSTIGEEFTIQLGKMLDAEKNVGLPKPFLGNRAVQWGRIDVTDVGEIKLAPSELQRFRLRDGDLLVCEGGEVGRCAIWRQPMDECYYQKALHRLRPRRGFNISLMLNLLHLYSMSGVLQNYVTQTSIAHLPKDKFETIPIPVPPTETEQQAIAEALSDADALIEALEQLLVKKRQIKQGAMQELLTGQKRLPGFSGKWVERCIAEVADCLDNLRIPLNDSQRVKIKGDYPYCGANGVLDYIDQYCVEDSVVLIAEDGGYFDEYLTRPIAYRMSGKFWVNNHAHILKSKPDSDQDFLFYSLVHKNVLNFLASGTRAKLNKSELNKIAIELPCDRLEQTAIAIATVLSDLDAELAALETKLAKARQLKQGMMQELLTGRIRLV